MKLKKIASLMLAGVMAVSMLAGCSNTSGNGGQLPLMTMTVKSPVSLLMSVHWSRRRAIRRFPEYITLRIALWTLLWHMLLVCGCLGYLPM